jgi:hypothetical protein
MGCWREGEKNRRNKKRPNVDHPVGHSLRLHPLDVPVKCRQCLNNVFLHETTITGISEMSSSLHLRRKNLACKLRTDVTDVLKLELNGNSSRQHKQTNCLYRLPLCTTV